MNNQQEINKYQPKRQWMITAQLFEKDLKETEKNRTGSNFEYVLDFIGTYKRFFSFFKEGIV